VAVVLVSVTSACRAWASLRLRAWGSCLVVLLAVLMVWGVLVVVVVVVALAVVVPVAGVVAPAYLAQLRLAVWSTIAVRPGLQAWEFSMWERPDL
jgi:hypothetical protein